MDWWEFPEEAIEPVKPAPLVRSRADRIAQMEEEVHSEAATIIADALRFTEIRPEDESPPQQWIDELGEPDAWRRFQTAKYALCTPKEAPIGLRLAKDTLVGMSKAKAQSKKPAGVTLNMVVNMAGPLPQYPRREILK